MNALLIAGTDTRVGKTVLTSALIAYWHQYHQPRKLGVMKPVQTGGADNELYSRLFNLEQTLEEITPFQFERLLPVPIAAQQAGRKIKLEKIWQAFESLSRQREWVLVEGCGGFGSPLTRETTVADLAWDCRIPVVLVVPVQSSAIAQAVANVALAERSRVHLKGIVLNCVQPCSDDDLANWASPELLQSLTQKPVLGCIPHLADTTDLSKLAQVASNLDLERIIPL